MKNINGVTGRDRGRVVTLAEFTGASPERVRLISLKIVLGELVRASRIEQGITQSTLAKRMESHTPRISQIEGGVSAVGFDLIFRALVALQVPNERIGQVIAATVDEDEAHKKSPPALRQAKAPSINGHRQSALPGVRRPARTREKVLA